MVVHQSHMQIASVMVADGSVHLTSPKVVDGSVHLKWIFGFVHSCDSTRSFVLNFV